MMSRGNMLERWRIIIPALFVLICLPHQPVMAMDGETVVQEAGRAVEPVTGPVDREKMKQMIGEVEQSGHSETEAVKGMDRPLDMILVLDNSGSMKKNDPDLLVSAMTGNFFSNIRPQDRLGVVIFDTRARLVTPLAPGTELREGRELEKISQYLDYRGQRTNIHVALERAVYALKDDGRADASKSVILLTDGKVDTGDPEMDLDRGKWLRETLATDAAANGIRICGIAFTENADYLLLQSLAVKTRGRYFRALSAEKLPGVLEALKDFLEQPPVRKIQPQPQPQVQVQPEEYPDRQPLPEKEPQTTHVAAHLPSPVAEQAAPTGIKNSFQIPILVGASLVILGLIILLLRRKTGAAHDEEMNIPEVTLEYLGPNQQINQGGDVQQPFEIGQQFTFKKAVILLGRKLDQQKQINDLPVPDPENMISKEHAKLIFRKEEDELYLMDRNSINGTYLGGVRLNSEASRLIKSGDTFSLYHHLFRISIAGKPVMEPTELSADDGKTRVAGLEEELDTSRSEDEIQSTGKESDNSEQLSAATHANPHDSESEVPDATGDEPAVAAGRLSSEPEQPSGPVVEDEKTRVTGIDFCVNHPSRQAEQLCADCKKTLCNDCGVKQASGQFICHECQTKKL